MRYICGLQTRGGAVWQLVGLITRRSQVQILSPQPDKRRVRFIRTLLFLTVGAGRVTEGRVRGTPGGTAPVGVRDGFMGE